MPPAGRGSGGVPQGYFHTNPCGYNVKRRQGVEVCPNDTTQLQARKSGGGTGKQVKSTSSIPGRSAITLRADDAAVSQRRPAHRALVRQDPVGHPRPLQAYEGLQRAVSHGLRRLRAAGRKRRRSSATFNPHVDATPTSSACASSSRMGAMFDWAREIVTCCRSTTVEPVVLPEVLSARAGLPARRRSTGARRCKTTLANEQVRTARTLCERCGTPVIKKDLEQWFFRITDYAEELLNFAARVARARQDDADELDRAQRRRDITFTHRDRAARI